MQTVIGVRFKKAGKIYYFDPDGNEIAQGEGVIVETARGVEYGDVALGNRQVPESDLVLPLKKVMRVATDKDKEAVAENKLRSVEAGVICQEKADAHKLGMKIVDVEYTFDKSKVIFYFTADGRIDFRELVKDLAAIFRIRIELRQIGVRDEAKMLGGIGPCGRTLCCSTFLGDFNPVSIKMAKDQRLSLNPAKISGVCGRLMCCLKYENDNYEGQSDDGEFVIEVGAKIMTTLGPGTVLKIYHKEEMAKVKLENNAIDEFPLDEITEISEIDVVEE